MRALSQYFAENIRLYWGQRHSFLISMAIRLDSRAGVDNQSSLLVHFKSPGWFVEGTFSLTFQLSSKSPKTDKQLHIYSNPMNLAREYKKQIDSGKSLNSRL
jgi:hypothetical protein